MTKFYDREGTPISSAEWSQMFENTEYLVVKQDDLKNGLHVSTVWLGFNNKFGDGPPLIFETRVFNGPEEYQERYPTLAEAEAGHQVMIEKVS